MNKIRVKLDVYNLVRGIDDILAAEEIDYVKKNAFGVGTGIGILCGYLKDIAQYAIDKNDDYLIQLCLDLGVLKEEEK